MIILPSALPGIVDELVPSVWPQATTAGRLRAVDAATAAGPAVGWLYGPLVTVITSALTLAREAAETAAAPAYDPATGVLQVGQITIDGKAIPDENPRLTSPTVFEFLSLNGLYAILQRALGEWVDAHAFHVVALGPMNTAGDSISIDFHVNDDQGNILDPKPIVHAVNLDNVHPGLIFTDRDGAESATLRIGAGLAALEAADPATNGAGPKLRVGLDGTARTARVYDGANVVADLLGVTLDVIVYSASMTPDARAGGVRTITATNATAFTINAPTNPVVGGDLTIRVKNGSGGALGVATWDAVYKMAAWVQPTNGLSTLIRFYYDGANWIEWSRVTGVPN